MSVFSNVFYKKSIYEILFPLPDARNLTSRPPIGKKLFYMFLSIIFTAFPKMVWRTYGMNNVQNILVLKFDKAILKKQ